MRCTLSLILLSLTTACATEPSATPLRDETASVAPPPTHDARMQWWRDARFGMFIHWGLYAIPAGEWGGQTNHGEWIRDSARIPLDEYVKFQPQFNPVNFDADAWAKMAADAGMKYLVITSKHHDGFALFDSKLSEWDVMNTPFGRDVLAELSAACERHGVRFCTYHSIMDWHHPDYLPRRPWEKRSSAGADFGRFRRYLHGQVAEVVEGYHPDVMWFDGEWESTWTHEYGVELFEHCRELDPWMLVNNRVDVHRGGMQGFSNSSEAVGDFGTPEQEIPSAGLPGVDWETCMTMNDHWGFNAHDTSWKSTRECIRMLVDIASKGGNYLLNVGPRADGTFPQEAVERLAGIGAWMKMYGDSIHGTTASPFDELSWGRCTMKKVAGNTLLYLHVFERPESGEIVLPGVGSDPLGAVVMSETLQPLGVRRTQSDLRVQVPETLAHPDCSVIVLELGGDLIVYRAPEISAESDVFVETLLVELVTRSSGLELRYTLDGSDPGLKSAIYAAPITVDATATVRARGFHRGRPVTRTVEREFVKVAPKPALTVEGARDGLRRQTFRGKWEELPDFAELQLSETQVVETIAPLRDEFVGCRFSGLVEVPSRGLVKFVLTSDDGSRLWVDGELVVDNDGLHGAEERSGVVALDAGFHALRLDWFNRTGNAELALRWAPVGASPSAIQSGAFKHVP